MFRQNFREVRGSKTWELKGVPWLECSMDGRKHSVRLERRVSSHEAFLARARSWILPMNTEKPLEYFVQERYQYTLQYKVSI